MVYLFVIFYITLILATIYFLTRNEPDRIRWGIRGYFALITLAFIISMIIVATTDADIESGRWILIFSYLFVIPFLMAIGYRILGLIKVYKKWQMIVLGIFTVFNLLILGYVLLLIFTLMFYNILQ